MMKKRAGAAMKIVEWKNINKITPLLLNKKSVLVGGCFDIFHFGHLSFLKRAKRTGDFLIVALESDEFIRKNKQRAPIHSQRERAETLAALEIVDLIIMLPYFKSDKDYFTLVEKIRPKTIAITSGDERKINKKQQSLLVGAKLKIVSPRLKKFASSKIIKQYASFSSD